MNFKKYIATILIISQLFILTSCKKQDVSDIVIKYNIIENAKNLDPQSATDYASNLIIQNTFEGLLKVGKNGELTEGVAKDFSVSQDGLVYTFNLKKGIKWSDKDATPVTSNDFLFAFKRLINPVTNSPNVSNFFNIKNAKKIYENKFSIENLGVKTNGDYQIIFELEQSDPLFPQLLTTTPTMPCNEKFFIETKGKYGLDYKNIISNNVFYVKMWVQDEHQSNYISLRKNKNRTSTENIVAGINFFVEPNESKTVEDYNKGNVDALIFSGLEYDKVKIKDNYLENFANTTWGIGFNQNNNILKNKNIRLALTYATDLNILKDKLPKYFQLANGIVPPNISILNKYYRELTQNYDFNLYNIEKSKECLNKGLSELKLKVSDLNGLSIVIPDNMKHLDAFSLISQNWQKELNIFIEIKSIPFDEYKKIISNGNYDMAIVNIVGGYNNPKSVLDSFLTNSSKNIFNFKSTEYDNLLNYTNSEISKMADQYVKAEKMIIENGVFIPLYNQVKYFSYKKDFKGLQYFPENNIIDFTNKN